MPPHKKTATAPTKTLEAQLWDAADKMRGAAPPTHYQHVCLGMDVTPSAILEAFHK
jgi:type I restriction-modification system DNA methylase subunit